MSTTAGIAAALILVLSCRAAPEPPAEPRTIAITVSDSRGYLPAHLELLAGEPVRLAFHSEAEFDCMRQVVSDDLGIELTTLPKGETTIIEVTPQRAGTFTFTCGMGMVSGTVVVKTS